MSAESNFEFRWATPDDEPDIRALIGSVAMPGAVAVRFAREPDYFLGTTIMGDPCDVLVARHQPDGQLAGIACRAEQPGLSERAGSAAGLYWPDPCRAAIPRALAGQPGSRMVPGGEPAGFALFRGDCQ